MSAVLHLFDEWPYRWETGRVWVPKEATAMGDGDLFKGEFSVTPLECGFLLTSYCERHVDHPTRFAFGDIASLLAFLHRHAKPGVVVEHDTAVTATDVMQAVRESVEGSQRR
jgi:hypothetical protein